MLHQSNKAIMEHNFSFIRSKKYNLNFNNTNSIFMKITGCYECRTQIFNRNGTSNMS